MLLPYVGRRKSERPQKLPGQNFDFVTCDSAVRAVRTTMCSAHNFMFHEGRRTYERDHNTE